MYGGTVCVKHGGAAPQVRAAADRRRAQQVARAELTRLGRFTSDDSLDITGEMQDQLVEDRAEVALYRSLVEQLEPGYAGRALVDDGPTTREFSAGIAGPNHLGDGAPHVFVVQYEKARERYFRHLEMAAKAGIEERRLELAEWEADAIYHVLEGMLTWLFAQLEDGRRDLAALRTEAMRHLGIGLRAIASQAIDV